MIGDNLISLLKGAVGEMLDLRSQVALGQPLDPALVVRIEALLQALQQGLDPLHPAARPGDPGEAAAPPERPRRRRRRPRPEPATAAEQAEERAAAEAQAQLERRLRGEHRVYTPAPLPPPPALPPETCAAPPEPALPLSAIAGARPADGEPVQRALLGIRPLRRRSLLALTLDVPLAMAALGVPGAGKSTFKGAVVESALVKNRSGGLRSAYCALVVALGASPQSGLEYLASAQPNHCPREVALLHRHYPLERRGLADQVIYCLAEHQEAWREVAPFALVLPLRFSPQRLTALGFNLLMGVHRGQQPLYMRALSRHLRALKAMNLASLDELRRAVERLPLSARHQEYAQARLQFLAPFYEAGVDPCEQLRPGRLIHLAVPTDALTPQDAEVLMGLMLDTLVLREGAARCPLIVDVDEAHEVLRSPVLLPLLDTLVRRRRHLGVSSIFCTHEARAFPPHLLGLLDLLAHYQSDDREALSHLRRALAIFGELEIEELAALPEGWAWLWARQHYNLPVPGLDPVDGDHLLKLWTRPRFSHHGGFTRRAL